MKNSTPAIKRGCSDRRETPVLHQAKALNEMGDAFLASADQTAGKSTVLIDTLYYSTQPNAEDATSVYETFQTLIAKAHAGDLDFLVTGSDTVNQLIYNEFFLDLSSLLPKAQLSAYQDRILYMDRAFLESIRHVDASTPLDKPIAYPDPTDPTSMEDPVAVLIDIRSTRWISTLYPEDHGLWALGFVANGQHTQTCQYPYKAHTFGQPETVTAATCTKDGKAKVTCSACGATEDRKISAAGHKWVGGTCTQASAAPDSRSGTLFYISFSSGNSRRCTLSAKAISSSFSKSAWIWNITPLCLLFHMITLHSISSVVV